MSDFEVIVKGELHHSPADLEDEKTILDQGVNCLVLEQAKEKSEFQFRYIWFNLLMWMLNRFLFKFLYTDPEPLEDITHSKGGKVMKTRESNSEIIQNATLFEELFSAATFLLLTGISIYVGTFLTGLNWIIIGYLLFLFTALAIPLLLRGWESSRENLNRDEIIANKIVDAVESGGRIVAVVGESHKPDVIDHLPEWVEPKIHDPVYQWYHPYSLFHLMVVPLVLVVFYGSVYFGIVVVLRAISLYIV